MLGFRETGLGHEAITLKLLHIATPSLSLSLSLSSGTVQTVVIGQVRFAVSIYYYFRTQFSRTVRKRQNTVAI